MRKEKVQNIMCMYMWFYTYNKCIYICTEILGRSRHFVFISQRCDWRDWEEKLLVFYFLYCDICYRANQLFTVNTLICFTSRFITSQTEASLKTFWRSMVRPLVSRPMQVHSPRPQMLGSALLPLPLVGYLDKSTRWRLSGRQRMVVVGSCWGPWAVHRSWNS